MDRQEFEVTVRETLLGVERAIEELALDGVETYPTDKGGMQLMFDNGGFILLNRNDAEQQLDLLRGDEITPFYYDSVEEHWFTRAGEQPLLQVLSSEIGMRLSRSIILPDLI
jgi:frataxin-like iron-binding protein CyaY